MITERELKSVELSPTKKDFYQIWNELLDTASKLSERWDPASTNESDPGIVLLKVLTAIADKLNYTVDKNILEAYMPSATQEESMRKLCEMLGYDMKYFQSATTDVTIRYTGTEDLTTTNGSYQVVIPKYSYVTNTDKDIVYCLLEDVIFANADTSKTVEAIEGQLVQCKINMKNTTVIDASQIDDNNRYYFPEAQIAENGIFVYSCKLTEDGKAEAQDEWKKVSNLNTQAIGAKVYKFGFDSRLNLPYIQFADDIRDIIGEGLNISFVRTNGVNGNISAGTLTSLQNSSDLHVYKNLTEEVKDTSFSDATKYTITNKAATNNGKNKETLNSAYNNYKKTIGTFDTLVTCRDYINKIYRMTEGDFEESRSTTPLVSNVIVSDIRDDINRAYTLCSFNEYGISYSSKPFIEDSKDKISHFDLILYPFKTVNGLNTKSEYKNSFTYTTENVYSIKKLLQNEKTISHNIVDPENDEIACIKNYVRLNAKITTVYKVGVAEEKEILNKIYTAIYENFNARKIDFGEEIPYDTILEVIENADTRIKNVSLEEPELFSKVCLVSGEEIDLTVGDGKSEYFDKVVLSNILAGKVSLFNYITDFKADYSELPYSVEGTSYPNIVYPESADKKIVSIETSFKPSLPIDENNGRKLLANEVIEFRTPNLKTTTTYPAYVNYYLNLANNRLTADKVAIPATFVSFKNFIETGKLDLINGKLHKLTSYMSQAAANWGVFAEHMTSTYGIQPEEVEVAYNDSFKVTRLKELSGVSAVFEINAGTGKYTYVSVDSIQAPEEETSPSNYYYYFKFQSADDFADYEAFIREVILDDTQITLSGLYNRLAPDLSRTIGELIDINKAKYVKMNTMKEQGTEVYGYTNCYVQETHLDVFPTSDDAADLARASSEWHTKDGLGRAGEKTGITENSDYMLQAGDYLLINYTSSSTDENGAQTTGDTINLKYGEGTIIKPNFTLSDSATRNMLGDAFEKVKSNGVEGFHFEKENPPGMYTLGVNDKIEIRDNILVEFGGPNLSSTTAKQEFVNIYFQLAHEEPENNFVTLKFDEDNNTSYTLKEGEFFYYTDKNETELGYFGCGTKITRAGNIIIKKPFVSKDEEEETYDNILTYGLLASIPWQPYTFDATNYLTVTEYKYITLSEDDTIYSIDFPAGATDQELSSEWVAVNSASYKFSTDKEEDNPQKLPEVVGAQHETGWQACSKLYLNMSPVKTQKLNANDVITIKYSDNTTLTIEAGTKAAANGEVSGETTVIPVSVKANDLLIVHDSKYIVPEEDQEKLKIKIIEEAELNIFGGDGDIKEALSLNNFGNGWTKVITNNVTDSVKTGFKKLTELHTAIQRGKEFGIVAVYYITSEAEIEKFASMTVTYTEGTESESSDPVIFNNFVGNQESWWDGYKEVDSTTTYYFLKPGLNVIKLNEQNYSPDITFYYGKSGSENDIILFSELDLVDAEMPLNPWLGYDDTEAAFAYDRLCGAIRAKYDPKHEFYYNVVPEASTALNMNTAKDITDNDSDILTNPRMLYDYNNYFNKFVISEIDDEAMKKGIMIARSSRK